MSTVSIFGSGNGRDGAGRESGRVLDLVRLRDSRRRSRRPRARPSPGRRDDRPGTSATTGRSSQTKHERLHDLVELAADCVGGVLRRSACRRGTRGCAPRLPIRGGRRTPVRRAPARPLPRWQPTFRRSVDEGDEPVARRARSSPRTPGSARARKRSSTRALSAQTSASAAVPASAHGESASEMPAKTRIPPE